MTVRAGGREQREITALLLLESSQLAQRFFTHTRLPFCGQAVDVAHDAVAGVVVRREDHLVQRHATRVLHLDRMGDRIPEQALEAPAHQVHQLVSHVGCGEAPVLSGIVNCPPCRGAVHCGDPAGELGDSVRVVLAKAARQHRGREEHPELDLVG